MEQSVQSGITVTLASDETGESEGGVLTCVDSLLIDLQGDKVNISFNLYIPVQC